MTKTRFFPSRLADAVLRLLHRLLGTDVRFFAKNTAIITMGHSISILRGIITGYLVARMFPRDLYGEYRFVMSIFGAIGVLSVPGITNALMRAVARGEKGILPSVAKYQFLIALTGSVALLLAIFLLPPDRSSLWPVFVLMAVVFPFWQTASTVFPGVTVGKERFDISFWANFLWSSVAIIATLLIIFLHPSPALLFLTVVGLPTITYFAFTYRFQDRSPSPASVKHIIRYGFQLTLIALPISIAWYLDDLLISMFLGLNQLAVFSVGTLIPEQLKTMSKELLPVSYAVQARGNDTPERRQRLLNIVWRMTLLFALGILVYILLAPWIFRLLFPNYPEAVLLTQLAAATLVTIPSSLIMQYLEAQALLSALRWTQWISSALFCISLGILIPTLHLVGAVLSLGVLRISYAVCSFYFLAHFSPTKTGKYDAPGEESLIKLPKPLPAEDRLL